MQYRIARAAAERCFEKLDAADVLLRSPSYTGMPKGGAPKDMADTIAQLERLKERAEKAREKAIKLVDEISEAIYAVEDAQERTLLWMRYIDGRRWFEISEDMHISERTAFRIHGTALQHVKRGGQ